MRTQDTARHKLAHMTEKQDRFCDSADFQALKEYIEKLPAPEVTEAMLVRLDSLASATALQQVESEIKSSLKKLQAQAEEHQESMTMKLRRVNTELTK